MFTEKIIFPVGILVGKTILTEAILEEETFAHTLKAPHLAGIDTGRFDDEGYYSAALLASRLQVPGLFEARLEHDPRFRDLVEDYADAHDLEVQQVTAAKIHPVSPEIVENLHRLDGNKLLANSSILEKRRSDFRKEAVADEGGSSGASEDGLHRERGPGKKQGRDKGDL